MIWRISSSNPISRIRSASSITSALRLLKTNPFVFCARKFRQLLHLPVPAPIKRTWR